MQCILPKPFCSSYPYPILFFVDLERTNLCRDGIGRWVAKNIKFWVSLPLCNVLPALALIKKPRCFVCLGKWFIPVYAE